MRTLPLACAALATIAVSQVASANLLTNGSLETSAPLNAFGMVTCTPTSNSTALTGWTVGGSIDICPSSYWQASNGNYSVDMIGTPGLGSISQTVTTVIGDDYSLFFDISFNPETLTGENLDTRFLEVSAIGATTQSQTYQGWVLTRTKGNMKYITRVFSFTADSTSTTIKLESLMPSGLSGAFNAGNVYCGAVIDNLDLERIGEPKGGETPEPSSLGLLGAGAMLLLRRRAK